MSKSTTWGVCLTVSLTLFSGVLAAQQPTAAETAALAVAARNKATTLRSYAAFNEHKLEEAGSCYAADFVDRTNTTVKGPEGVKADFVNTYKIWPDVKVKVLQIVAEGDWVMARCVTWATHTSEVMGLKPTNKKVEVIYWSAHRYNQDGLMVESWNMLDNVALMQQLGLLPGGSSNSVLPAQSPTVPKTSSLAVAARNKAATLQSYAAFNDQNVEAAAKLYAPEFVDQTTPSIKGPEGVKANFANTYKVWPDVKVKVEQIVAEGDWVMVRCVTWATHTTEIMGVKPTNQKIEATWWDAHRYNQAGLIIESWNMLDNAALMQQLGLLPK